MSDEKEPALNSSALESAPAFPGEDKTGTGAGDGAAGEAIPLEGPPLPNELPAGLAPSGLSGFPSQTVWFLRGDALREMTGDSGPAKDRLAAAIARVARSLNAELVIDLDFPGAAQLVVRHPAEADITGLVARELSKPPPAPAR